MLYKGFISYSHAADGKLAPALQSALHRFAKPWYRLRALRVFRDKTSLSLTPQLWPSIEKALSDSEYFLLLASPDAAASQWVQQEVEYWLQHQPADKILIVLTDGELAWDRTAADFNWSKTTAVPTNLQHAFAEEPLWLDLRWARTAEDLSLRDPRFRDEVAALAATLHGRPKDEIVGEDVRQHQRTRRLAWSIGILLLILTISASLAAYFAIKQSRITEERRREAERQRFVSIAQSLAASAPREQEQGKNDERAALLARQAYLFNERYRGSRLDQVDKALREVLNASYFSVVLNASDGNPELTSVAFSRTGQWLAAAGDDLRIRLWDLQRPGEAPRILPHQSGTIWTLAFNPTADLLAAASEDGDLLLWELRTVEKPAARILGDHGRRRITSVAFSPHGERLASASDDGRVRVWNLREPETKPVIVCCHEKQAVVWAVAFHPEIGSILATSGSDRTVRLWELPESTGRPRPLGALRSHDNTVRSVAFSPDGGMLASGTDRTLQLPSLVEMFARGVDKLEPRPVGGTVVLWDLEPNGEGPKILEGHEGGDLFPCF